MLHQHPLFSSRNTLPPIQPSKKDANTYTSPRGNDASTNTEKLGDRNVNFDDGFPIVLQCPISHEPLEDPVITNTGQTFSREYLMEYMRTQINANKFSSSKVHRYDGSRGLTDLGRSIYVDSVNFRCPVTKDPIHLITENTPIKHIIRDWPKDCNQYIIPDDAFILYKKIKDSEIPDQLLKLYNEVIVKHKLSENQISKIIEQYKKKSNFKSLKSKIHSRLSRKIAPIGGTKKKKRLAKRITVGLKNKKRKKRLKRTRKLVVNKI
tara:strand:+ start:898 stop:1692 length:795 start_codon:yes stop_codon:yes gene_type:complete